MQGSKSKISSKNLIREHCAEGFNSGVEGLRTRITNLGILKLLILTISPTAYNSAPCFFKQTTDAYEIPGD
jgi:hypothetical protein